MTEKNFILLWRFKTDVESAITQKDDIFHMKIMRDYYELQCVSTIFIGYS